MATLGLVHQLSPTAHAVERVTLNPLAVREAFP